MAWPYCTVCRSPAEYNRFVAADSGTAQLWSLIHAVLDYLGRTRNCNRKAIRTSDCLVGHFNLSKTSALNLVNIKLNVY